MLNLEEKREQILRAERRLAGKVAGDVVDKPELSLWMILIPVFFVFYYFQFKRYKDGLKTFSQNFLLTRERTLDVVYEGVNENRKPDLTSLLDVSDMPEETKPQYLDWITVLAEFYIVFFTTEGKDYNSLVQTAYKSRSNFLLILNKLNRVEQDFNKVLMPHLGNSESLEPIVKAMEKSVKMNRKDLAEEIFQ